MKKIVAGILAVAVLVVIGVVYILNNQRVAEPVGTMILATTTSTYDSGLLHYLLPEFESKHNLKVEIISVGTGQAIEIGKSGDADIILVHSRKLEDQFIAEGFGTQRWDVMFNDFVFLGPKDKPGNINTNDTLVEALNKMIAHMEKENINFVSRGDNSGTHVKEKSLWPLAGLAEVEKSTWYRSIGQGMGETLLTANEMGAYVLTDRGTYLARKDTLPNLVIVYDGAEELYNPYGLIPVNPEMHAHVKNKEAMLLVNFFISADTQNRIGEYGIDKYGQPLFFPNAQ